MIVRRLTDDDAQCRNDEYCSEVVVVPMVVFVVVVVVVVRLELRSEVVIAEN